MNKKFRFYGYIISYLLLIIFIFNIDLLKFDGASFEDNYIRIFFIAMMVYNIPNFLDSCAQYIENKEK